MSSIASSHCRWVVPLALLLHVTACNRSSQGDLPSGSTTSEASTAAPPPASGASASATKANLEELKVGPDAWSVGEVVTVATNLRLVVGDPETGDKTTKTLRSVVVYEVEEVDGGKPVLASAKVLELESSEGGGGAALDAAALKSRTITVDARSGEEVVKVQGGGELPEGLTLTMPTHGGDGGTARAFVEQLGTGLAGLSPEQRKGAKVGLLGVSGEGDERAVSVEIAFDGEGRRMKTTLTRRLKDGRPTRSVMDHEYGPLGSMRLEQVTTYGAR